MIKKFFTAVHEFLVAWGEHRYQMHKNRIHSMY
jgi:hypothetical protein